MGESHVCLDCGNPLKGTRFRKYCRNCGKSRTNQNCMLLQRRRGLVRKLKLVQMMGGGCSNCEYNRSLAGITFHHVNPDDKGFSLDMRSLSNRAWSEILKEAEKCILLCSVCHAEEHNPDMQLDTLMQELETAVNELTIE
jgi:hypothetical protein